MAVHPLLLVATTVSITSCNHHHPSCCYLEDGVRHARTDVEDADEEVVVAPLRGRGLLLLGELERVDRGTAEGADLPLLAIIIIILSLSLSLSLS